MASAADTTVVVVTPGWGDSMQANKAGLLEMADIFVINKADRPGVREARRDLEQMLDLAPPGRLAAADRRDRRRHAARGSPSCGRGGPPPGPPDRLGPAGGAPGRTGWPRSCAGCCWRAPRSGSTSWSAGEEFATAVKALAAGELDPYEAAERPRWAEMSQPTASAVPRTGAANGLRPSSRSSGVPTAWPSSGWTGPKANALSVELCSAQLHAVAAAPAPTTRRARSCSGAGGGSSPPGPTSSSSATAGPGAVGASFAAALGAAGRVPRGHHRRHQRLRPRRRAGAGLGLRLPRLRRRRPPRAARGAARRHPRRRRHPAPAAPHRVLAGQGDDLHRAPGPRPTRPWPSGW